MAKNTIQIDNNNNIKDLWLGDSWFVSVQTEVQVAEFGYFIGIIKTVYSFMQGNS